MDLISKLRSKLKQAKISHKAAVDALPYMPKTARPYTLQTIDKYVDEIFILESDIKAIK